MPAKRARVHYYKLCTRYDTVQAREQKKFRPSPRNMRAGGGVPTCETSVSTGCVPSGQNFPQRAPRATDRHRSDKSSLAYDDPSRKEGRPRRARRRRSTSRRLAASAAPEAPSTGAPAAATTTSAAAKGASQAAIDWSRCLCTKLRTVVCESCVAVSSRKKFRFAKLLWPVCPPRPKQPCPMRKLSLGNFFCSRACTLPHDLHAAPSPVLATSAPSRVFVFIRTFNTQSPALYLPTYTNLHPSPPGDVRYDSPNTATRVHAGSGVRPRL